MHKNKNDSKPTQHCSCSLWWSLIGYINKTVSYSLKFTIKIHRPESHTEICHFIMYYKPVTQLSTSSVQKLIMSSHRGRQVAGPTADFLIPSSGKFKNVRRYASLHSKSLHDIVCSYSTQTVLQFIIICPSHSGCKFVTVCSFPMGILTDPET